MSKKMTPRRKAQLILGLAMKINSTSTRRELTGNKPTVFINFSGHINQLEVYIHSNGWFEEEDPDYCYYLYLSDDNYKDEKMNECIALLKDIWQQYKPAKIEEVSANAV